MESWNIPVHTIQEFLLHTRLIKKLYLLLFFRLFSFLFPAAYSLLCLWLPRQHKHLSVSRTSSVLKKKKKIDESMHKKTALGVWEWFVHVKRPDLTFWQQSEVVVFDAHFKQNDNLPLIGMAQFATSFPWWSQQVPNAATSSGTEALGRERWLATASNITTKSLAPQRLLNAVDTLLA